MLTNLYEFICSTWKTRHKEDDRPMAPLKWWEEQFHCDTDEDELETAIRTLRWGTYGIEGKGPLVVKLVVDLDTAHLENILIYMKHQPPLYNKVILAILKERYNTEGRVDETISTLGALCNKPSKEQSSEQSSEQ